MAIDQRAYQQQLAEQIDNLETRRANSRKRDERAALDGQILTIRQTYEQISRELGPEHPDLDEQVRTRDLVDYRWEQIGAHERIARRRAGGDPGLIEQFYRGPEATAAEREQAQADLQAKYPHLDQQQRYMVIPIGPAVEPE